MRQTSPVRVLATYKVDAASMARLRARYRQSQSVVAARGPKANGRGATVRLPKKNSGVAGQDTNLTGAGFPNNEIESQFLPATGDIIFSADIGPDEYPSDEFGWPDPLGFLLEPDYLAGPDYRLYSTASFLSVIPFADRGEYFEPTGNLAGEIAFSAFLGADNDDAYGVEAITIPGPDGEPIEVTPELPGPPVRVIAFAPDALTATVEDPPDVTILKPQVLGVISFSTDPTDPEAEVQYMPVFLPDASPVWHPRNSRFIYFVSLRGFDPTNPDTQYTSLWVWDTQNEDENIPSARQVLSIPGKSILHPRFSRDGSYLAFTVTDFKFTPVPPVEGAPAQLEIMAPDPVFGFDVSKDYLAKPFTARINVAEMNGLNVGPYQQVTTFSVKADPEDPESADLEPRDMMPFWSELDQLGFSSDRKDTDDDDIADAVETDPAAALFDIYTFRFPYVSSDPESIETPTIPDATPRRRTLGPANGDEKDEANELNGSWEPVNSGSSSVNLVEPSIMYQSDNTGNWDIWYTSKSPLRNLPVKFNGNILVGLPQVNPKLGVADDEANIAVRVNPTYISTEEGVTRVFAIVKDPDNRIAKPRANRLVDEGFVVDFAYQELDSYPVRFRKADLDAYREKFPEGGPQFGSFIELTPDATRGAGWYSARWYTPVEVSDYLIDVIVTTATEANITDNIGGFSTAPFVPYSRVLLVSDFAAGQRAVGATTNTYTTAGVATESYFTSSSHPTATWAPESEDRFGLNPLPAWPVLGPRLEWETVEFEGVNPLNGRPIVKTGKLNLNNPQLGDVSYGGLTYDLWRTQCREPITMAVLKNYLPYTIQQPGYPNPAALRTQRIADRSVFWFAPHAGQLNGNAGANSVDVGTIANFTTQAELIQFLNQGGRLLLTGDDVAFTLSQEGSVVNPLLTQLKARFGTHYAPDVVDPPDFIGQRHHLTASRTTDENGLNPIPFAMPSHTWRYRTPNEITLAPFATSVPFSGGAIGHPKFNSDANYPWFDDAAWTNLYVDAIGIEAGGLPIYTYDAPGANAAATEVYGGVQFSDPISLTENAARRQSLFFSFGLEGVVRSYFTADDARWAQNELAEILHNAAEFFTTGTLTGNVFITNNVESPKNVLVWVISDSHQSLNDHVVGTALTGESGAFTIEGLVPASYRMFAYKTGYAAQNPERVFIAIHTNAFVPTADPPVLTSGISTTNILLIPVQPGTLRGVVKDAETGLPLAGATVTIRDITNTVSMTTTTAADGTYVFNAVPAGLYIVTVPEQTLNVNDQPTIFGEFTTNVNTPLEVKTDTSPTTPTGDTIYNVNLNRRPVPPLPATLEVIVWDESTGTPAPAVGAVVTVLDPTTNLPVAILEGGEGTNPVTIDETGKARMTIRAGQVIIRVTYQDYTTQSKSVLVQPDEGNPNGKTTATFRFGGVVHVFPAGNVLMASTPYNYTGTNASPLRFSDVLNLTDEQLDKAIVAYDSGAQNFVFYPTYPADTFRAGTGYGMKLPADGHITELGDIVSSTNGYYVVRANIGWNLIGNPFSGDIVWSKANATGGAKNVKFALRDDATRTLHDIGDTADSVSTSVILTGDIVWGASATDQYGNGVYNGNYAQHDVIVPWQSYWVKVAQPVLFYFPRVEAPESQSVLRLGSEANLASARTTILPAGTAWGLDITATTGKMTDRGLGLGLSTRATAGLDAGIDIPKPNPLSAAGPTLFTSFVQPNSELLATDVRNVGNNDWTFTVSTNLNAQNITLSWTPTGRLASGATLVLVDTATNRRVNMAGANQYTFRSARGGGARRFRVELRGAATSRPR